MEEDAQEVAAFKRYCRRRRLMLQQTSLLLPPLSPYRELLRTRPSSRQELSDAVDSGDIFRVRRFRLWWNLPFCTAMQPGHGEIYPTLHLALIRRKEVLAACMLLDPATDLLAASEPSGRTALMLAAFQNCTLGLTSQLLQAVLAKSNGTDALNLSDAKGHTALDCATLLSPIYLMLRRHGALHASELRHVEEALMEQQRGIDCAISSSSRKHAKVQLDATDEWERKPKELSDFGQTGGNITGSVANVVPFTARHDNGTQELQAGLVEPIQEEDREKAKEKASKAHIT